MKKWLIAPLHENGTVNEKDCLWEFSGHNPIKESKRRISNYQLRNGFAFMSYPYKNKNWTIVDNGVVRTAECNLLNRPN